ncbi:MAG: NirA family protein, partial [Reyranella sp.]
MSEFDDQQKQWLQGFVSGIEARKAADKLASRTSGVAAAQPPSQSIGPDALQYAAQDRAVAAGGKLVAEETAKRARHPLDRWDEVVGRAEAGQFPKGIDVFLTKYQGLFYVAPAQDSFMCRLRIPNGIFNAWQMRGLADAACSFGGGYADVTTRANLQIREIGAAHAVDMLLAVQALGLTSRGSGADNIRNITGSPTAGIDPQEIYDTRPLCSAMH